MKPHLQTPLIGMVIVLLVLSSSSLKVIKADVAQSVALPGCQHTCGNVSSIPFPFGIGANCFLDPWYEIECKPYPHPNSSTRPFLSKFNVEVLEIVLDTVWVGGRRSGRTPIQTMTVSIPPLKVCTVDTQRQRQSSIDLRGGPYNFSTDGNVFLMEGCAGSAVLVNHAEATIAGCTTVCRNNDNTAVSGNKCYRVECCQTQLPSTQTTWPSVDAYSPLQFYHIDLYGQSSGDRQNCIAATLIKNDSLNEYIGNSLTSHPSTVPVELYWSWVSSGWPNYNPDQAGCFRDQGTNMSTSCLCNSNRFGNPYVFDGCQVPKECNDCATTCVEIEDHTYFCPHAGPLTFLTSGGAIIVYIGLSIAIGPLLMVFGCRWLYYFTKRRKKTEKRVRFFKLMMQRHRSSNGGGVEYTKLFTHKELDQATDHFNENRVLGKGGQGTVYKGMLVDGQIVAVKKSKVMDESQMEQFINEMVILSQINHRHVVKVLGCCLETEVPLLVYEFISNGTLHQHIHEQTDANFRVSWGIRLKIAADSAGAIAYLHSSSSTPIYHRDIKPSNILLDDKYRTKVSDFGSSKTISMDQTHLTTLVQGTIGYLDPEYFESNIFTEKSDVYSFGVVMLELLTGKKPIYRDETMEQKSLVREFFSQTQDFGLSDMLDPEVVKEAKEEELMTFVDLAKRCLNESGRLRPTMKEVAMTLEMIIKSPAETATQNQQAFSNEGFSEIVMVGTSNAEFMSSPIVVGAASPMFIDVEPLLRDTI